MPQGIATPPEIVAEIKARSAAGESTRHIAADLPIPSSHVNVFRINHGQQSGKPSPSLDRLVTREKRHLTRKLLSVSGSGLDRALEGMDKLDSYRAGILACAAIDKVLLLTGQGASSPQVQINVIGSVQSDPRVAGLLAELDARLAQSASRPALPPAGEAEPGLEE